MGKEPDAIRQEIEETRSRMGETVEAIGYKADVKTRAKESIAEKKDSIVGSVVGAKERVVGSIVGTKESVVDSVSGTGSAVADATPSASDVRAGAQRTVGLAQENPLGLAVGSVALGFLAGLMVPATRVERERIGPIADQVKETARTTGQEALERGKQVAQETAQVAREAAQEAAQRTIDTAKSTAQDQGQDLAASAQQNVGNVASSVQGQGPSGAATTRPPQPPSGDLEDSGPNTQTS